MYEYETLDVKIDNGVARLTLNRPKKLNAMNEKMMHELSDAFSKLDNDANAKAVVLSGAGERAFSAGADLDWSEQMTAKDRVEHSRLGQKTLAKMEQMGKPIFAAVHGYALGGGLELALAADWIVCSESARLGFPEITLSADEPYRPKIAEDGDPGARGELAQLPFGEQHGQRAEGAPHVEDVVVRPAHPAPRAPSSR